MTIKAIFFDMGGTIETFGYTKSLRLGATPGIQKLLESMDIHLNLSNESLYEIVTAGLRDYHQVCIQNWIELPSAQVWKKYIFKDFQIDPLKLDQIAEQLMFYIETQYYERKMRPEVPHVLEAIRQRGLKIGLISNVNSKGQVPANLSQYGIKEFFETIVLSSEYGYRKPDPAIFHYAARQINVPVSECCYVGDRIDRDIKGAAKAGFRCSVQIRHDFDHGEEDSGATPDAIIDHLDELIPFLDSEKSETNSRNESRIKAILFDAGDILYFRPDRGDKFNDFIKTLSIENVDGLAQKKDELVQLAYRGNISQDQYRESVLQLYGISDPENMEIGKNILDEEDNSVQFFEGVTDTLLALKRNGFYLGIITDTANSVSAKLSWFEKGGFGHIWDSIISSKEIGTRKPDPEIYKAALSQLNINANQAVFVGHKETEINGAHAVGIKTIAFNYDSGVSQNFLLISFPTFWKYPGSNARIKINAYRLIPIYENTPGSSFPVEG